MRARTLADVASAVGASLLPESAGSIAVHAVQVDSRRAAPGVLFVALVGERSDGHAFVADALDRGAAGAVVRRGWTSIATSSGPPLGSASTRGPLLEVDDPARALLDLAAHERGQLTGTVIGITGSTGKTCTKDLVAAVLRPRFAVVASRASFNNEVGLPLTLLEADEETEAIVCEMGSRGPGHIRLLCDVARPQVGVVTNVGVAHMELFGSPEVLRDAKAELPESLPPTGTAVLNADDPVVRAYAERTRARSVVLYGSAPEAAVRATDIELSATTGAAAFVLRAPDGSVPLRLAVPGAHMVPNALAAAAVGWTLGIRIDEVAAALAGATVSAGRMEVHETPRGVRVIDDSYNANPTSMAAALRSARWMAGTARCIAVLGHMAELGPISAEEHERLGELLARLGIDEVVVVGAEARLIARAAEREGVEPDRIHVVDTVEEAASVARELAEPGDLVLVKASRVVRLERVTGALLVDSRGSASADASEPSATEPGGPRAARGAGG